MTRFLNALIPFVLVASSVAGCGRHISPPPQPAPPARPLPTVPALAPQVPLHDDEAVLGPPPLVPEKNLQVVRYTPSAEKAPPLVGNFGYLRNQAATAMFIQSLGDEANIRDANPALFVAGATDEPVTTSTATAPTFLYRALYKLDPDWKTSTQGIGDCVSHGWAHACDISLAVDIATGKAAVSKWLPAATEAIYGGSRVEARGRPEGSGGWGDGSYGSAAAKFVSGYGIVYRQNFPQFGYDLTTYSSSRAKQWGNWGCGGQGDNGRLDAFAKKHAVGQVAVVTNFEEAAIAIANGYPVAVCSGQGFSNTRDADGFAKTQGSWAHCLLPGTVVSTIPPKVCEEVEVGDIVVTHEGNLKPIEQLHRREFSGLVTSIRVTGCLDVTATPEHPILIYRPIRAIAKPDIDLAAYGGRGHPRLAAAKAEHDKTQPQWEPIGGAVRGDYLLVPRVVKRHGKPEADWSKSPRAGKPLNPMAPNSDIAYFLGNYLADGSSVKSHKIQITTPPHAEYQAKLIAGCEAMGIDYSIERHESYDRFIVYSATMANSFRQWFGDSSATKHVPGFVFGEGWDWTAFLDGYCDGDGTTIRKDRKRITTVSPILANQIWLMTVDLGLYPMMGTIRANRPGAYDNAKPSIYIEYGGEPIRKGTRYWRDYYCLPVREVTESPYSGTVYNYEVADDHSYLASGVVHHNCMLFCSARHDRPGLLCLNSWGTKWISGPKYPPDQPDGSFWVEAPVVTRMLSGRDSFAVSNIKGFPKRRLPHGEGW